MANILVLCKVDRIWGRGGLRKSWWRQADVEQQLEATLKNISAAAGEQQRRESDRRGGGEVGEEVLDSGSDG